MFTDAKRLQQILKNLLSNAFKFTHHGQVTLTIEPAQAGWSADNEELNRAARGAGVLRDATPASASRRTSSRSSSRRSSRPTARTSRKYGGTGLGLAISRELSRLLGGEIRLVEHAAARAARSRSTCRRPTRRRVRAQPAAGEPAAERRRASRANAPPRPSPSGELAGSRAARRRPAEHASLVNEVGDDRDDIQPGDRVAADRRERPGFARFLLETAREKGFKGLVTSLGAAALALAREYKPDRDHAGHLPARHRRLARARPAQERPLHAAHPGVRHLDRRGARARASTPARWPSSPSRSSARTCSTPCLRTLLDVSISGRASALLVGRSEAPQRTRSSSAVGGDDVEVTTAADAGRVRRLQPSSEFDCVIVEPQLGVEPGRRSTALRELQLRGRPAAGDPVDGRADGRRRCGMHASFDTITVRDGALARAAARPVALCSCTGASTHLPERAAPHARGPAPVRQRARRQARC